MSEGGSSALDCGWPRGTETVQSETIDKGVIYPKLLCYGVMRKKVFSVLTLKFHRKNIFYKHASVFQPRTSNRTDGWGME